MAVPLQIQLFDAFLGTQESIHSIVLPDIFSSGGSKNVYIDKFARVSQINGYTKVNASAFTTDTGGSASMIRGLIPYRGTSGGSITRKLVIILDDQVNEWEVHVSTDNGATKSFLYDAGAGSVNMIPDSAQFGDNLYLTNGKIQPRLYNGTAISTTGLSQSPTVTATASASSGNLTGNYRYKLVSTYSDATRKAGSTTSTSVLVSGKQLDLTWTADPDGTVQGYEIYRTTGTGTTFYYLTSIASRVTAAYTDNTGDLTILEQRILEEHGDAPPVSYFCEPHKQRMWWLRTDTYPTRGYWSDPGIPESVYAQSYLDFSDSDTVGDVITGGFGNYEGLFVVFTEKAIWSVSGTGQVIGDIVDWTKTRTNAQTGAVSHRTAVRIPAGSKYSDQMGKTQTTTVSSLAYLTPLGDIRLFDGDNDLIVSNPVRDTLATVNYAQRAKSWALHDSQNDQVAWFFATGSSSEPDTAVVWNYRYGVWYTWTPMPFGHGVELDTTTSAAVLLTGEALTTKGGYVYTFNSGNSFDGVDITAQWMTKTLYGVNEQGQPALSNKKRWRWADLLFKINSSATLTIEWLTGSTPDTGTSIGSVTATPAASTLITASGSTILTSSGSSLLLSKASAQVKALLHTPSGDYMYDEGLRLRIGSSSSNGTWSLEGMELAFQILPGLKRRDQ